MRRGGREGDHEKRRDKETNNHSRGTKKLNVFFLFLRFLFLFWIFGRYLGFPGPRETVPSPRLCRSPPLGQKRAYEAMKKCDALRNDLLVENYNMTSIRGYPLADTRASMLGTRPRSNQEFLEHSMKTPMCTPNLPAMEPAVIGGRPLRRRERLGKTPGPDGSEAINRINKRHSTRRLIRRRIDCFPLEREGLINSFFPSQGWVWCHGHAHPGGGCATGRIYM